MATMVECSEGGVLALFPESGMTDWNGTVVAHGNRRLESKNSLCAFAD